MSWEFLEFVLYGLDSVCRYRVNGHSSCVVFICSVQGHAAWRVDQFRVSSRGMVVVCSSPLNLLKDCHIIGRARAIFYICPRKPEVLFAWFGVSMT